ncbi:type II secretion system F family protein [Thermomonospora amylolytica]|uniref:type II secretion system F family protein n=1 Tax=Thermomonospora amylolytica TaxID=1411117 RepID=UPI000E6B6DE9|nr:type II secretion system F family protein [Thermomonospora amylolytica]
MFEVAVAAGLAGLAVWVLFAPPLTRRRLDSLAGGRRASPGGDALRWGRERFERLRARRGNEALWRASVIELCDGMAAELRAGRVPEAAFASAVAVLDPQVSGPVMTEWRRCQAEGTDDVADPDIALERLAERPGAEGLRMLAACWRIGADKGGAFAPVIEGLVAALRDEEAQRQEIAAQLAGPRATARLLAVLPIVGLGMAAALGADPLAFLFGTVPGSVCLALGIGLDALGLWWTHRLAQSAQAVR